MAPHPWARTFAGAAEVYERGRPGYPAEAVAPLGLGPGKTVLDVGAGTGKLSRVLAATGATVVAVEPLAELRAVLERVEGITALAGTAEALPLAHACVDAVAVGHAFHWFDGAAALAEIHRVLRPGGRLALLWNRLELRDPLTAAFADVLERHRAHPALDGDAWRAAFERAPLFGPLERATFPHVQAVDADTLAARLASESSIAALPAERRERALDEVRALAVRGAALRYVAELYSTRRL